MLSNSVVELGTKAFAGCISLEAITISATVEYIGELAFGDCISLAMVTFKRRCSIF